MRSRLTSLVLSAVTLITAGLTVSGSQVASAGTTTSVQPPTVQGCHAHQITTSGARLNYTECNDGGSSSVVGTVQDTDADGQCAYATVSIGTWQAEWKACPKNTKTDFNSGSHPGNDAQVRLSER
jgi:hypothetical protein